MTIMIDFFDKYYSSIQNRNKIFSLFRIYSILRFSIRLIANFTLPVYFVLFQSNKKYSLISNIKNKNRVIVSLTSFPARINRLWLVIETLLRQSQKPDKIILWLSTEQFPNLDILPKNLLKLQKRGLNIRLCNEDLRSHKKYYYAIKEYPEDIILTVDDDVFYHSKLIEDLLNLHEKFPNCVCANSCSEILVYDKQIQPYNLWKQYTIAENPNDRIFPIGMGGILYPPKVLNAEVLNSKVFLNICPFADDIWLNVMTKLKNTKVVKTNYNSTYLPVINYQNTSLSTANTTKGMNDKQLVSVRKHCIETIGKDPFSSIIT
jgi:hypothetical protein